MFGRFGVLKLLITVWWRRRS